MFRDLNLHHLYGRRRLHSLGLAVSFVVTSQTLPVSFPPCVTAKETDTHKLWRNIEPHLKKAMQTVYLREVSRSEPSHL